MRREKIKGRKRKLRRDAIYYEHLIFTVDLISNSSKNFRQTKSYDILALILLYVFGLRVSNLLILRQSHLHLIKEYFRRVSGGIKLPVIKSGKILLNTLRFILLMSWVRCLKSFTNMSMIAIALTPRTSFLRILSQANR